jgi:hypothetical protein
VNPIFAEHLSRVEKLFDELDNQTPAIYPGAVPSSPGVYVFLDGACAERVGRSGNLKKRLQTHIRRDHNSGSYAFKRARQRYGTVATYKKGTGRKDLQQVPEFDVLFREEIDRIRRLFVKWIVVENDIDQYLLEVYAAIEYGLDLNEFGNS